MRSPAIELAGKPTRAALSARVEPAAGLVASGRYGRCPASRQAGTATRPATSTSVATVPSAMPARCIENPGSGSARRASPMGMSGDASAAIPAPASAPAVPTRAIGSIAAASSWPRDAPSTRTVSWPLAASDSSLARLWPTTTSVATAARAANSTRATAWTRAPPYQPGEVGPGDDEDLGVAARQPPGRGSEGGHVGLPPLQADARRGREVGDPVPVGPVEGRRQGDEPLGVLGADGHVVGEPLDRGHPQGQGRAGRDGLLAGQQRSDLLGGGRPEPQRPTRPQPPAAGQGLADADLVRPVGVRAAPGDDQGAVDGPADPAVDTDHADEPGAPPVLPWVAGHRRGEQGDALQAELGHLREPPHAVQEAWVVEAPDLDLDVVGQGRLQQAGVGGVGAAGADGGGHDGAGGHPDQQGQPQQ